MTDPTELERQLDDTLAPDAPDLHAWLDGGIDYADTDGARLIPEWEIDGQRTAEWALRRLRRAEGERAAAAILGAELRAQADEYEARVARRTDRDVEYFTDRLRAYHNAVLAENPKAKTVQLPSATLKRIVGGVSLEVTDHAAAVAWLEENDEECLDYKDPAIKKNDVKAKYGAKVDDLPGAYPAVDEPTGEVVPGIHIKRGEPTSKVTWITATPVEVEPDQDTATYDGAE